MSQQAVKPRSWSQLKTIVEFSRKLIFSLNSDAPSSIKFRQTKPDEYRVYFLASNHKREVTIKYITVNRNKTQNLLVGQTIFESSHLEEGLNEKKLTKEEQLLRERQRCAFSGITQYSLDANTGRFVFSERSDLFSFDDQLSKASTDEGPTEITTNSKGAIDVKICPHNPNLITYVLEDNLWLKDLVTKTEIKLTNTQEPLKSGVPSYAVQEEFSRYSGYWWVPNGPVSSRPGAVTYRLIYEETDETGVELTYITPSCTGDSGYDEYRYPRAGTPNSKVFLKMVEVEVDEGQFESALVRRKRMRKDFYELFGWFEYLTRAEITPDGNRLANLNLYLNK